MSGLLRRARTQNLILYALCMILVCLLVLPSLVATAGAQSTMISGVASGSKIDQSRGKLLAQAGINWIRADVRFDSDFRNLYSISKKYRISIVGILDYGTMSWSDSFTLQDWNAAVAKAQKTYPLIHVWEIWNEPTLTKYQLGYMDGTPQHYLDMLQSAYQILKAEDANCIIIGLAGSGFGRRELDFASTVFSLGGGAFMDAMSIHAYPSQLNIGQTWDYYKQLWATELQKYKALGKPIWVTETGLESSQLSESDQATYLKNAYEFFGQQQIVAFFWYQLKDYGSSDGTLVTYGLIRTDLTTKPSYDAYKQLLAQ